MDMSTRKYVMPLCFGASGSVRARQTPHCASVRRRRPHLLPGELPTAIGRTALVRSDARSEPAPGSLNSWHQKSSPLRVAGTNRSTCSGLPCSRIVGAAHQPITRSGRSTPAAANSRSISNCSAGEASRPYGFGQCGACSPASASAICRFSTGWAATSATAAAISGCRCSTEARSMCSSRRTPCCVSAATRRSQRDGPPRNCEIPYARRRYKCASCSQVMPMPPST